jgi:hypothetical protein
MGGFLMKASRKKARTPLRLFLNSVPKSGTHLLQQIALGMPNMKISPNGQFYEGYPSQMPDHYRRLYHLKPFEMGAGHVYYSDQWAKMVKQLGVKQIIISRDPRDIVVSFTHFIVNKYPQHELHPYFTQNLNTHKQRYQALIRGVDNHVIKYPSVAEWFNRFYGWTKDSNTLHITYEELMRSYDSRMRTLNKIARYIWKGRKPPVPIPQMAQMMDQNINPQKSVTFRSGQIGGWRTEFDEETKTLFKNIAGYLLIQLGYEKDSNW